MTTQTSKLSGKQRRHLRALGHPLTPLVQIGKHGVTEGTTAAVDAALEQHELIKVRVGTECPEEPDAVAEALGQGARAEVAQRIGRVILLYRRRAKDPKIVLPPSGN